MNIPDSILVDMVANHLIRTPGVEIAQASSGIEGGFSYTAIAVVDLHDTVEPGPWTVRYSISKGMIKLSVVMQDCDEPVVFGVFCTEREGKRQGGFVNRKQWADACGRFEEDYQREIVVAILTNGEFYAETPDYLKDYQKRYRDIEARDAGEIPHFTIAPWGVS